MTNKVLVTGGAGFVGANLVRHLLASGRQVTVLDNLSAGNLAYLEGLPIVFLQGDILDYELVGNVVRGQDEVIHLAAQTGVPGSIADPHLDCRINVLGTLNLLDSSRHAGVSRFIFASSNAPLGRQPPPATEDKVPLPISPYGASKLAGEGYCLAYHGSWGLGTVALRFANLYGPYSRHKKSVVAKFFLDIETGQDITVDGDGKQTRDFIYVDDLCRAVLCALQSNVGGEVYQIATGTETNILELAGRIKDVTGRRFQIDRAPARRGDIRHSYSGVCKARKQLGWIPQVDLQAGLEQTWAWFQQSANE